MTSRSSITLAWLALLFAPALPAYLWVWPRLDGCQEDTFQMLTYLYLLGGGLLIARLWGLPSAIGFTRRNFWPGLLAGLLYTGGVVLGLLATNLAGFTPPASFPVLAWQVFFYFALVAFTEEWIFRGLLYSALDERRGAKLAILGSALAFGLYHLPSQGARGFLATMVFGLFAALVRHRTASFLALILIHGLYDIVIINLVPSGLPPNLADLQIDQPLLILLADALFLGSFVYIWRYRSPNQSAS